MRIIYHQSVLLEGKYDKLLVSRIFSAKGTWWNRKKRSDDVGLSLGFADKYALILFYLLTSCLHLGHFMLFIHLQEPPFLSTHHAPKWLWRWLGCLGNPEHFVPKSLQASPSFPPGRNTAVSNKVPLASSAQENMACVWLWEPPRAHPPSPCP